MTAERVQQLLDMERFREISRSLSLNEESKGRSMKGATLKKNISDIFQCLICFNKIKQDAMLCPHCSKLWCKGCITKWLLERKSECPHCREHLTPRNLVNCRFASDLSNAIDDIPEQGKLLADPSKRNFNSFSKVIFSVSSLLPFCPFSHLP